MQIAFDKRSLRELCENEDKARNDLGPKIAENLKSRLADLNAATSVSDLVAGQPREFPVKGEGIYAVSLSEGYRIIFCPNHTATPVLEFGEVDWQKVSRVKILRIEKDDD